MANSTVQNGSIVTDGLLVHLDAANPKSYIGSGTSWNNLMNANNRSTLINAPIYNSEGAASSFTFDGINECATFTNTNQFLLPTFTVCSWSYPIFFNSQGTAVFSAGDSLRLILGLNYGTAGGSAGGIYFFVRGNTAPPIEVYTSVPSVTLNKWHHHTFVVDLPGSNIKGYVNGQQVYSNTNSLGSDFLNGFGPHPPVLASRYGGASDRTNARIATFSFYNKVLTQAEAIQNYNALKGRFGL
jgi:hypothetical protein